jgi:MFS family permease
MSRHELRSRELTSSTAALFALFVGAFSVGMAEFVIAGILPQLAEALRVGAGAAGLLVTVYALGVAVGGPLLTAAARRLSRKSGTHAQHDHFHHRQRRLGDGPRPRSLLLAGQHLRRRHVGQRP